MQVDDTHRIGYDKDTDTFRVTVFLRQLKGHARYYARYTMSRPDLVNGQRHITESLKTDHLDTALERARQRHAELKHKADLNIALKPMTVSEVLKKYIREYKAGLDAGANGYSQPMYYLYNRLCSNNAEQYIGHKHLNAVTVEDMQQYDTWRRNNALGDLTDGTILTEVNAIKAILRWATQRGYYQGRAYDFKYKKVDPESRSALTLDQYRRLYRYMRTKKFLYGHQKSDKRHARHRQTLRAFILFMVNTGLRPGEARNLTWQHVTIRQNAKGQQIPLIEIPAEFSKVRKNRTVIGRQTAYLALLRYKKYLIDKGETVTERSYLFATEEGNTYNDMGAVFRTILTEAGVDKDVKGNQYTIYCLRHTYITFRIMYARNLDVFKLASNCGTSTVMITKFYSHAKNEDFIDVLS